MTPTLRGAAMGLAWIALGGSTFLPASGQVQADRPNVVIIMVDDMGYADTSPFGGEIRTPNIQRLATEGITFRNFYNNAKCAPTRASLLTGVFPHEAGFGDLALANAPPRDPGPYQGILPPNVATVAELLRDQGYRTYMAGKWHLGEKPQYWPRSRGFDRYFGLISGANSFFEVDPGRQMALDDDPWTPPAEGYYSTDAYTDFAVDRIVEHRKLTPNQPFLLYLAHQAPHSPLMALPEDIARYRGRYDAGWDVLRAERNARQRQLGIIDERHEITQRPEGVPAWVDVPETEKASWIGRMEVYAAMIDRVDQGIGRVLAALEQTGQRENTLVVFLSDNGATTEGGPTAGMGGGRGPTAGVEATAGGRAGGRGGAAAGGQAGAAAVGRGPNVPMGSKSSPRINELEPWASVSNTPYRLYKNFLHEGGIKTGMVATWPRGIHRSGVMSDQLGHVVDVMPTILQVTGIRYPASRAGVTLLPLRGQSLVPAFEGQTVARTAPLFWAYGGHMAVREGDWKLVYNRLDPQAHLELYDLATDPTEHHDLSARYPDRAAQLRRDWLAWADKAGAREAASIHALPR